MLGTLLDLTELLMKMATPVIFLGAGVIFAISVGGWPGLLVGALLAIAALFDLTIAEIEVVSTGVRYRRLLRWRHIPFSEMSAVRWPVFGVPHLRLPRPLAPWGRLYFHVRVLTIAGQYAILRKIEEKIEPNR